MRKQKKVIVWLVYFDSSKTRKEGRKIPKSVAVSNPNLAEIRKAAEMLGLQPEVEVNATHPTFPWRKSGRIHVQKSGSKMQTLLKIAKEIVNIRQQGKK